MTNQRQAAEAIFRAGIASAQPDRLVREQAEFLQRELRAAARVFVVGAGKASAIMAREVEDLCGDRITAGHVVVKHGHGCALRRIALTEAGHPVPDANSFKGAAEVLAVARRAGEGDILLCLWSGGASALLADGPPGAQPDDMIRLNDALVRSGADIAEINCVRKHLSSIKGGQLARAGAAGPDAEPHFVGRHRESAGRDCVGANGAGHDDVRGGVADCGEISS